MLDVAIIGAGAAGLGAAKAAISRGLTFKVLEAASYIGGRARTDTHSLGVPFDLGCHSLYGGEDNPLQTFASEIGSRLEPVPEKIAFHDGARFLDSAETNVTISNFERLETDLISAHESSLNTSDIPDRSQASAIDADNPSAAYFRQAMHMEFTAAAADISLTDPLHGVLATVGAAVLDGYGALILRAAADVPVVIDCPVTAIDLSGRQVVLETSKGQIDARAVLVTASTAVLAAERIALRPDGWSNQKLNAIDALPIGSITQIGFRLKPGTLPQEFARVQGETTGGP